MLNCIFSSDNKLDYTTITYQNKIIVYGGCDLILELDTTEYCITGATYINNILYFTKNEDNSIYLYSNNKQETKITLSEFKKIKLLKYINNSNEWFVLEINCQMTIVYDLYNRKTLFRLPIQHGFVDLQISKNGKGIMIGCDERDVSRYVGDDDIEYTIMCSFKYVPLNKDIEILDTLRLVVCHDDWDDKDICNVISDNNMIVPLYTGYKMDEKSISAQGNFIIYYSDESKRIVISKYENGSIFRIFILPKYFTAKAKFYFNENFNIFSVFDNGCVEQYIIEQSEQEIDRLNNLYKCKDFKKLEDTIYQTIFSCKCINICAEESKFEYDVALSFAGEDREYVDVIANRLKNNGIKVFYDKFEVSNLWGKDLYQYLSHIYKDNASYCVIFISEAYKNKTWTRHELRNAQNRAFIENKEYILPIFLENVELDGLNNTIGYLSASEFSESEIVDLIIEKIHKQ